MEENDVAVQDEIPVEVLEAEDDANLANFNVRNIFFTDFLPLNCSLSSRPGSVWVQSKSMPVWESEDETEWSEDLRRELIVR